jgi:hypothetical protein
MKRKVTPGTGVRLWVSIGVEVQANSNLTFQPPIKSGGLMVSFCANPDCGAEFLYLHEGELFVIELSHNGAEYYWLCPSCAHDMRVVYDPSEGAKVEAKSDILDAARSTVLRAIKKPAGSETVYKGSSRHVWS